MRVCPECGASLDEGRDCRDYFHDLLGLEAEVPGGAGALPHFFAVASYNLQHPSQFAPDVLPGLRAAMADALTGRATVPELRQRAGQAAEGATRVLRRDGEPSHALGAWPTQWPMTVRDVCAVPVDVYAEHARAWAASVSSMLDHALPPRR